MTPDYRALYLSLIRDALVALRWHDDPHARGTPPPWPRYLAAWVVAGAEQALGLSREELERRVGGR